MDDLLSAALCQSGLGELLGEPENEPAEEAPPDPSSALDSVGLSSHSGFPSLGSPGPSHPVSSSPLVTGSPRVFNPIVVPGPSSVNPFTSDSPGPSNTGTPPKKICVKVVKTQDGSKKYVIPAGSLSGIAAAASGGSRPASPASRLVAVSSVSGSSGLIPAQPGWVNSPGQLQIGPVIKNPANSSTDLGGSAGPTSAPLNRAFSPFFEGGSSVTQQQFMLGTNSVPGSPYFVQQSPQMLGGVGGTFLTAVSGQGPSFYPYPAVGQVYAAGVASSDQAMMTAQNDYRQGAVPTPQQMPQIQAVRIHQPATAVVPTTFAQSDTESRPLGAPVSRHSTDALSPAEGSGGAEAPSPSPSASSFDSESSDVVCLGESTPVAPKPVTKSGVEWSKSSGGPDERFDPYPVSGVRSLGVNVVGGNFSNSQLLINAQQNQSPQNIYYPYSTIASASPHPMSQMMMMVPPGGVSYSSPVQLANVPQFYSQNQAGYPQYRYPSGIVGLPHEIAGPTELGRGRAVKVISTRPVADEGGKGSVASPGGRGRGRGKKKLSKQASVESSFAPSANSFMPHGYASSAPFTPVQWTPQMSMGTPLGMGRGGAPHGWSTTPIPPGYIPANTNNGSVPWQRVPPHQMQAGTPRGAVPSAGMVPGVPGAPSQAQQQQMEDDEEEMGYAETYAEYMPSKLKSGLRHPDPVVETSSLASVLPPDIRYNFSIPEEVIDTGQLSALQLEAIVYASQKHECILPNGERAGYLIGDGAGVGKGRTVAGVIFENYLIGRKRALWFSVSSDLRFDAERDLKDIGAHRIKVYPLNKFKYAKISGRENGAVKKGVIFATYSSLIGETQSGTKNKYRSRLKQLLHWCGPGFDGVIVFDECHRAKNLVPSGSQKSSKTGITVVELQRLLPKARVVYASATGATEPRNMAYMTRLGLWGDGISFPTFKRFIEAVESRGVGAMEVVAMDMKLRGIYLARQLSFHDVTFKVDEVRPTKDFIKTYDDAVHLWLEAREQFQVAADFIDADQSLRKTMWAQFWSAHQRFFKYLCIAAKVDHCVRLCREAVKSTKCVVIGLQSTGEARTLEQLEENGGELTEFVSTAHGVFQSLVEKHFPAADTKEALEKVGLGSLFYDQSTSEAERMKGERERAKARESRKRQREKIFAKMKAAEAGSDETSSGESADSGDDEGDDEDDENGEDNSSERGSSEDEEPLSAEPPAGEAVGSSSTSKGVSAVSAELDDSKNKAGGDDDDDEEEDFNPFADDTEDFWLGKQQQVDSPPPIPVVDPGEEETTAAEKRKHSESSAKAKRKGRKRKRSSTAGAAEGAENPEDEIPELFDDDEPPMPPPKQFKPSTANLRWSSICATKTTSDLGLNPGAVMRADLLSKLDALRDRLPANTLDQLIDDLGGPDNVAEMTGRKGRVVCNEEGEVQYQLRNEDDVPLELLNMTEKERFMNGEKLIAVISEAASSGISLQADRRAKNQRRRVHITLELPWSADKAIQQFGRTHRSNQVSAPEYIFLISELAGEKRFASIVAKRLESLGALTHGDRRATESRDLSQFNLDTKYGRVALETTLKSILGFVSPMAKPPAEYPGGHFFKDMQDYLVGVGLFVQDADTLTCSLEKDSGNISKFLNRILGIPVVAQNCLFHYFSATLEAVISQAKRDGRYDMGIFDLGTGKETVQKLETTVFLGRYMSTGEFKTELHMISVERGMSWDGAIELYCDHSGKDDGFYVSNAGVYRKTAILVIATGKKRLESGEKLFNVYRPNTGLNLNRLETIETIKKRYKRVDPRDAEKLWIEHYEASAQMCQHAFWSGRCRNMDVGIQCEVGKRKRVYYVLSGCVLNVWNVIEAVLGTASGHANRRIQVIRSRTDSGQKIVGVLIPASCKANLVERLTEQSMRTYVEKPKEEEEKGK